jgi:DNA polymerase III sliding clamp (beta) subunit (PCNA family)
MLEALRFVRGAVAKKDFVPELTHYSIKDGTIKGFNGSILLEAPFDLGITAMPYAQTFANALKSVEGSEDVVINLTKTGRLSIRAGKFRTHMPCLPEETLFPEPEVTAERMVIPFSVLPVLETLRPFIGIDASRPWSNGILFSGRSAVATNNIVLAECWLKGASFEGDLLLPSVAIKEMLRIGKEPVEMSVQDNAVSFYYANGERLTCLLTASKWPDFAHILNTQSSSMLDVEEEHIEGVSRLLPFIDKKDACLYVTEEGYRTSLEPDKGTTYALDTPLATEGGYSPEMLLAVLEVASKIDLTLFPKPCPFVAGEVRGVILGKKRL